MEDGRVLMDAVGGAAVSCVGNGHPEVITALKDQVEKLACTLHASPKLFFLSKP